MGRSSSSSSHSLPLLSGERPRRPPPPPRRFIPAMVAVGVTRGHTRMELTLRAGWRIVFRVLVLEFRSHPGRRRFVFRLQTNHSDFYDGIGTCSTRVTKPPTTTRTTHGPRENAIFNHHGPSIPVSPTTIRPDPHRLSDKGRSVWPPNKDNRQEAGEGRNLLCS
jgi:hypothetical protein